MSKKSLINKKALRYIIANSNLCKHAIRELELAGYSKEEDGPDKWMREQVIEAVALFSSHGNSGFSAPFEINLVKKLCSFDIISPLRFDDGEWEKIGLDGSCQNKRKSSIFKEPDRNLDIDNIMDRGREDVKGRRRSVLMTPAVPERIRVLSPSWYRAAVEFQGKPESEQRDFCSWCCCTGGCNLCADISKYNIKGLKIYGG